MRVIKTAALVCIVLFAGEIAAAQTIKARAIHFNRHHRVMRHHFLKK